MCLSDYTDRIPYNMAKPRYERFQAFPRLESRAENKRRFKAIESLNKAGAP